jgi:hypothetical protein
MSLHLVAVAAAVTALDHVPGVGQVGDDRERAALGDPHGRRDLTEPDPGVVGDGHEHAGVIGEEAPGSDGGTVAGVALLAIAF